MLGKVVVSWCLLLLLVGFVLADETQVDVANRFLSAENTRQLKDMKEQIIAEMKAYNDENFQIFDSRMSQVMEANRQRVLVGGVGAILITHGIIGLAYLWVTRRYSYEHWLEKQLKKTVPAIESLDRKQEAVVQQLSAPEWRPQQPAETFSSQFGQVAAGQQSGMNSWQFQPAYEGAWQRPATPVSVVEWEAQQMREGEQQMPPWEVRGGMQNG